jgi:serine/threonine-protein kinase
VLLEHFDLGAPIGSGAMARVYAAVERKTGRPVAIKLLDSSARRSRELRERLAREARLLASVQSPHVTRLFGHGWDGNQPFLVLERLEGETLAELLRREGRVATARLGEWVEQLLLGVRDCHRAKIIHRDVKPGNIFLAATKPPAGGGGEPPKVKLIDFGVARLADFVNQGSGLTNTHHILGSVGYMAPEQFESARNVGPAADVYAVGVVIFRCLTGRLPFLGGNLLAFTRLKCEGTAPPVSSVAGALRNEALDALVARALERDPAKRFASASQMLEEWWRVAAALEREAPGVEIDVTFDEDEWVNTLAESVAQAGAGGGFSSATLRVAVRFPDDETDPEILRPTDSSIAAAQPRQDPPADG